MITREQHLEFLANFQYMLSSSAMSIDLQSRGEEVNNYLNKYIDKAKLGNSNPWHLILEDAIQLREDRSIKARTIVIEILAKLGMNIMDMNQIQELTDIVKKELE